MVVVGGKMATFLELMDWNDEFVFRHNEKKYEIISDEKGRSIYFCNCEKGTLIQSFENGEELLKNGIIDGKKICDIVNEIRIC